MIEAGSMAGGKKEACHALYSLSFHRVTPKGDGEAESALLAVAVDVSSFPFMGRSTAREALNFASRMVSERIAPGQKLALTDNTTGEDRKLFAQARNDGLVVVLAGHNDYPLRLAFSCIGKAMKDFDGQFGTKWKEAKATPKAAAFNWPALATTLKDWQTPGQVDAMMKTQAAVDEVKGIMMENIDKILKRGENLDSLIENAEELTVTTKAFHKTAKKANRRCCVVM